jgi:sialate O-acetylesterase
MNQTALRKLGWVAGIDLLTREMRCRRVAVALTIVLLGISRSAQAEDRLATIFQDNMVLQREMPLPVWGWADPGAEVEVAFGGQKKQAKADEKGYWKAILDPLTANRTGQVLTAQIGTTTISRKNVLVGEVWLTAGQSNMTTRGPDEDTGVYPHYVSPGGKEGMPAIRICEFGCWNASLEPMKDIDPGGVGKVIWKTMQENPYPPTMLPPEYFARALRDGVNVPVGILYVAVPGTTLTSWTEHSTLESLPPSKSGKGENLYQEALAESQANFADEFKASGATSWADFVRTRPAPKGRQPSTESVIRNFPSQLYSTRIYPAAPFAFRGAVWLQGGPYGPNGMYLVAMIRQWRTLFGRPFVFLCATNSRDATSLPSLAPVRSSFYRSYSNIGIDQGTEELSKDKSAALVELYDVGDWSTHYLNKAEAGRRMALAALDTAYDQHHLYSGPHPVEKRIEGGKATIRFSLVGDGLVYQPTIDGISGIVLQSKDGKVSRWGRVVKTAADTIEISHPDIPDIGTVAYGESVNPLETLFNSDGLPASPFTVNPVLGQPRDLGNAPQLLSMDAGTGEKTKLHIAHVRRTGYVFSVLGPNRKDDEREGAEIKKSNVNGGSATGVKIQAYIPAEWKGYEIENKGTKITATDSTKDGVHMAVFEVPADASWIIVAEAGKAAGFRTVNRY